MPAVSKSQQRYMGAALKRKREGKMVADDPKMTTKQLEDFAGTKHKGLPEKRKKARRGKAGHG